MRSGWSAEHEHPGRCVVWVRHDWPALTDEEAEHALDACAGLLGVAERRGAVHLRLEFALMAAEVLDERTEIAAGPEERAPERVPETPAAEVRRHAEVAADVDERGADRAAADFRFELLQGWQVVEIGDGVREAAASPHGLG